MASDSSDDDDSRILEVAKTPPQEELLPLLECPVCFELPLPPIRTCYQGHIICGDCCPKLSGCPLCAKPIGYGRNFFAEDFINKSTMRCKYREDGCLLSMTGAQIKLHIPICKYRPMKCEYCPKRISYRELDQHLHSQHQITRWDINEEGVRLIQLERRRRDGYPIKYETPQMNLISTEMLMKSLLSLTAVSFLVDQLMSTFYPDFYE